MSKLTRLQLAYLFFLLSLTYLLVQLLASIYTVLNWQLFGFLIISVVIWLVSLQSITPSLKFATEILNELEKDNRAKIVIGIIFIILGLIVLLGVWKTDINMFPVIIVTGITLFSFYKWVL